MKESDLAQIFVEYLKDDYDLYFEFMDIDIFGKGTNHTIAIEVKTSLNFKVIEQAKNNIKYANYSYIAVPEPKIRHFGFDICEMLGVGVLLENNGFVRELIKPKLNRNLWKLPEPGEIYKKAIPGTKNGEHGIEELSPFKQSIFQIERYVKLHQGCTIKEAIENTQWHWSNISSARSCIYNYIKNGVIDTIGLKDGKLYFK